MIKPSDKVLIGWITLVTTFASTNLGQVSASELTPANSEQLVNDEALTVNEESDAVEVADSAVANHAESIAPENDTLRPEFSSQSVATANVQLPQGQSQQTPLPAESLPVEQDVSEDRAAKLEHLVATATKPLPAATPANTVPVESVVPEVESEIVAVDGAAANPEVVATVSPSAAARFNPVPAPPSVNPLQGESRKAKLEHLAATATQELPSTSSLRERAASLRERTAAVTRELPVTDRLDRSAATSSQSAAVSPEQGHTVLAEDAGDLSDPDSTVSEHFSPSHAQAVTTPSMAAARERSPESSVVSAAVSRPTAAVSGDEINVEIDVADDSQPLSSQSAYQAVDTPVEAFPTSRVMSPGQRVAVSSSGNTQVNPSSLRAAATTSTLESVPAGALPRSVVISPDTASLEVSAASMDVSEPDVADTAQLPLEPPLLNPDAPEQQEIDELLKELSQPVTVTDRPYPNSPAITISNPSGFGADNFTAFLGVGYQERTRFGNQDDGGAVVGIGLGDARENVGVQLSYTVASFGGSRDFGAGGFNVKLHRRLAEDWSAALGWEGIITTDSPVDFKDSIYGSVSHLVRTRESITQPFSRVALTAGVGNGRFRTEDDIFEDRDNINVFGSVAVRVVEPVSAIVEWTGQDLAAGVSITPFRDLPLVLLPAVRDITGAGDGSRFVLGAGVSFQL
ncbi:MAG: hypothetical protein AAF579_20415 [Cyanobacteria bacterium P01_C01_bin.118]